MRRPALRLPLVGLLLGAVGVLLRRRAQGTERDVWTQAVAAPDLR